MERPEGVETEVICTTLLDLVQQRQKHARSYEELIAIVTRLVNTGRVQLIGNFAGRQVA